MLADEEQDFEATPAHEESADIISASETEDIENKEYPSADEEDLLDESDDILAEESTEPPRKSKKPLSLKKLESFQQKLDNTGIVYMSRVPPNMKPQKVRQLLSQYGQINRIYLKAEDEKNRLARIKSGGTKRKQFKEGWIEFLDKKKAKLVASLNNTPISSKNMAYYNDLWNLKYLPKFKWIHLKEQMAYEKKERDKKLALEFERSRKELGVYLRNVDKGKAIAAMEKKRKDRCLEGEDDVMSKLKRKFKQRKVVESAGIVNGDKGKMEKVIGKLFN